MTTATMPPVRTARQAGTCGAPECRAPIWPGAPIFKPGPGYAWRHADCSQPGRRTRAERAEDRAAVARARRR